MTPKQIELIEMSWQKVGPIAETAAILFYERLFELDPDLEDLFKSTPMERQRANLVQALDRVVKGLADFEAVQGELKALGRRHAAYGVLAAHYSTVGAALIWTLERGLADIWTAELRNAWTAAYVAISTAMKEGAAEGPGPAPAPQRPGFASHWQPAYNKFWI